MTSPSPPASSPTRQSTRSPVTAGTTGMSNNNASTPSKPHHQQHYHHHLPVGHTIHSPAHSATGEVIQGKPSEAGGLHTSTSRGNILVPPPSSQVSSDLLSITSSTTSNPSLASLSRPVSPSAAVMLSTPSSPVIHLRSSSSRPTSPSRSPNINNNNNSNNKDFDTLSNTTTPQLDSSAIFERDAEFATEHLLSEF